MNLVVRLFLTAVVFMATYFFMYWVPFSLIPVGQAWGVAALVSLAIAVAVAAYVWGLLGRTGLLGGSVMASVVKGAAIVGGIGFVGGFFGPMVFAPGANQGPLLGLLITGPLGVLVGAIGGLVLGLNRRRGVS